MLSARDTISRRIKECLSGRSCPCSCGPTPPDCRCTYSSRRWVAVSLYFPRHRRLLTASSVSLFPATIPLQIPDCPPPPPSSSSKPIRIRLLKEGHNLTSWKYHDGHIMYVCSPRLSTPRGRSRGCSRPRVEPTTNNASSDPGDVLSRLDFSRRAPSPDPKS